LLLSNLGLSPRASKGEALQAAEKLAKAVHP